MYFMAEEKNRSRLGLVGGQAVMGGVMMKSGEDIHLAVRGEDGKIVTSHSRFSSIRKKYKICNLPLIRGCVNMVEMLSMSMGTMTKSMEMLGIDDSEPETKFDKWITEKMGDKMFQIISGISMVLGVAMGIGLFLLLPTFLTKGLDALTGGFLAPLRTVIEGLIRMGIFVAYVWLVGLIPDIRRTYEFHGAEHKSIACFESGMPLTPSNAKTCTRFHPRCGTSFIFVMLLLSIIVNSFLSWDNVWIRFASKIVTLPLIVGLGFEFIMYAGKHNNLFTKIVSAPGLWMQKITTKEPDETQLSVAIEAILGAVPADFREEVQTQLQENGFVREETAVWEESVSSDKNETSSEAESNGNQ